MTDIKINGDTIGHISIAEEVLAVISAAAAMETEGVAGLGFNKLNMTDLMGKKLSKGIKVTANDKDKNKKLYIEASIAVKFGYKVQNVAIEVQQKIKTALETMTGIDNAQVNVLIVDVQLKNTDDIKKEADKIQQ
jgi:uncharacterized alkaline shock family protein YloU